MVGLARRVEDDVGGFIGVGSGREGVTEGDGNDLQTRDQVREKEDQRTKTRRKEMGGGEEERSSSPRTFSSTLELQRKKDRGKEEPRGR